MILDPEDPTKVYRDPNYGAPIYTPIVREEISAETAALLDVIDQASDFSDLKVIVKAIVEILRGRQDG